MARRLLIVGAGGHGRAVADVATAAGWTIAGFIERARPSAEPDVIGTDGDIAACVERHAIDGAVVGVGNTALKRRAELFERLRALGLRSPKLIHPGATISPTAQIGDGSVVFPGVVLGVGVRVGDNAVIYSGTVVEHGCDIADHAYLAPGVILCGDVCVESGAFLGAGAIVVPGVVIGKEAMVSALSRIAADIPSGHKVSGAPFPSNQRGPF